jgi:hypothetical protein
MKSFGDSIVEAVMTTGAIQSAHQAEGACIIVWQANAAEQLEAAMRTPMLEHMKELLASDAVMMDALALLKVSREKGDDAITSIRFVLAGFVDHLCKPD